MGWFTTEEEDAQKLIADALKLIDKMNMEMRAMSALMHMHGNVVCDANKDDIITHFNNNVSYNEKYESIKHKLPLLESLDLQGKNVGLWNGEDADVIKWEVTFFMTMQSLRQSLT